MRIFISGATGYLGSALIPRLLDAGHHVCGLCRPGSESRLASGCARLTGDALDAGSLTPLMPITDTYVHLVGVRHPAPWNKREFQTVDLQSLRASVTAAARRNIRHFVYVSVARPAPAMRDYEAIRGVCEMVVGESGLNTTILRPWYVLGPRHRWPAILLPLYRAAELVPAARPTALRLGLVTREQMLRALLWAIENPADGIRYLDVPAIRSLAEYDTEETPEAPAMSGV